MIHGRCAQRPRITHLARRNAEQPAACKLRVSSCFRKAEVDGAICITVCKTRQDVLSAYQEKIPARNAIYAHAQDFAASDELLLAILKVFIPLPLNKQDTMRFHVF
jgi:hypothetical protein